jgi:hypothetical protein
MIVALCAPSTLLTTLSFVGRVRFVMSTSSMPLPPECDTEPAASVESTTMLRRGFTCTSPW